jgi:hypothetical protein
MIGDSLVYGTADANNIGAAQWFDVDSAFAPVTFASDQAANTNDPPPFGAEIGPESLVAYNPGLSPGFGFEITLMKTLYALSPKYAYLVKCGIISALLDAHWLPTANYPTTSPNLYASQIARIKAYETSTGRRTAIVIVVLGTNDGSSSGAAGRMAANMAAMVTQLHSDFPDAVIVWPLVNINTVQTPDNIPTVRTQMLTYAATAPAYFMMPNIDHFQLAAGDPFHWDTPYVLAAGHTFAYAAYDLAGRTRPSVTTTPAVVGIGVPLKADGASATLTPLPEAGTLDGDTTLAFCMTQSVTPGGGAGTQTISCSAGWTIVAGASGQSSATGFTTTWAVYKRKVPTGEVETDSLSPSKDRRAAAPTFTIANGGDSVAQVITVRGPTSGAQDVDASQLASLNAFSTGPHTVPAFSTTSDHDLVLYFVGGGGSPGNASTLTALGVTGLTKIGEANFAFTSGDNVVLGLYASSKALAGSVGTASLSFTNATLVFASAIALKP